MCDHHGHCEHAHAAEDTVDLYNLYKFIDVQHLVCLNESIPDSGKKVFKPFEVSEVKANLFLGKKRLKHLCRK